MRPEPTKINIANALANPDWKRTIRKKEMRKRDFVIDTEAEFTMATEFGQDFDFLCNHVDPNVSGIAKKLKSRWWNTLNQHRECNLYREELTFHEIDRLNIATFCMALLRATYKTGADKKKHRFMGHHMSQLMRPLGYLVMGLIAKDHQGASPSHLYTSILHDIRMLSDRKERQAFYTFFTSHNKKFFEDSGLIENYQSYRKTTAKNRSYGKEFGINNRLVLKPQARALIEEFVTSFKQECEALTKEAVMNKNQYIHQIGKLGKKPAFNPLDDLI